MAYWSGSFPNADLSRSMPVVVSGISFPGVALVTQLENSHKRCQVDDSGQMGFGHGASARVRGQAMFAAQRLFTMSFPFQGGDGIRAPVSARFAVVLQKWFPPIPIKTGTVGDVAI